MRTLVRLLPDVPALQPTPLMLLIRPSVLVPQLAGLLREHSSARTADGHRPLLFEHGGRLVVAVQDGDDETHPSLPLLVPLDVAMLHRLLLLVVRFPVVPRRWRRKVWPAEAHLAFMQPSAPATLPEAWAQVLLVELGRMTWPTLRVVGALRTADSEATVLADGGPGWARFYDALVHVGPRSIAGDSR